MTIDISQVRKGDRVRITNATTKDEATFTVTQKTISRGPYLQTAGNAFCSYNWDTLEILSRALPTKPGLYASAEGLALDDYELYALLPDGTWQSDRSGVWLAIDPATVPQDLVRLVPETERAE